MFVVIRNKTTIDLNTNTWTIERYRASQTNNQTKTGVKKIIPVCDVKLSQKFIFICENLIITSRPCLIDNFANV